MGYKLLTNEYWDLCAYLYILLYCFYIYTHFEAVFSYSLCVFLNICNWHTTLTVVTPRSQLHPVPQLRASIGAEKNGVGAIDLGKSLGGQEELRRWRFGTFVLKEKWEISNKSVWKYMRMRFVKFWECHFCYHLSHQRLSYLVWQGVKGKKTSRPGQSKGCHMGWELGCH